MTQHKFKIGDCVKLDETKEFNKGLSIPFDKTFEVVARSQNDAGVVLRGYENTWYNDTRFLLVPKTTPLPLYSEEQAVSFLTEKGYAVTPPPEPLKGEVIVFKVPGGEVFHVNRKIWETCYNKAGNKILAVLGWTEGQGL